MIISGTELSKKYRVELKNEIEVLAKMDIDKDNIAKRGRERERNTWSDYGHCYLFCCVYFLVL